MLFLFKIFPIADIRDSNSKNSFVSLERHIRSMRILYKFISDLVLRFAAVSSI